MQQEVWMSSVAVPVEGCLHRCSVIQGPGLTPWVGTLECLGRPRQHASPSAGLVWAVPVHVYSRLAGLCTPGGERPVLSCARPTLVMELGRACRRNLLVPRPHTSAVLSWSPTIRLCPSLLGSLPAET